MYSEGAGTGRGANNIDANVSGNVNGNGNAGCVFDRLMAAAKEAQQRKAELGKMRPRGCTFQPQARGVEVLPNRSAAAVYCTPSNVYLPQLIVICPHVTSIRAVCKWSFEFFCVCLLDTDVLRWAVS